MPNFSDSIAHFVDMLALQKRASKHTVTSYTNDLQSFATYLASEFEETEVAFVKATHVRSWLASLKQQENFSPKTINRKLSSVRSFYKYLLKQNVVKLNPATAVIAPKVPKRLPQFVEEKDTQLLFTHSEFAEGFKGQTDYLILKVLYETGIRKAELIGLEETKVDFYNSAVKVLGKGNKERIIPISTSLQNCIRDYIGEKRKLFGAEEARKAVLVSEKGKALNPRYVYTVVNKYLSQVTTISKKSPHIMRHTFATQLMNQGADLNAVKELLGHSSLAATQVYTHNNIEKLKAVYKKAHPKA
jgi:integrase/recombinase XerC